MRHHVPLALLLPAIALASTAAACEGLRGGGVVADEGSDGGAPSTAPEDVPDILKPKVPYDLDLCSEGEYRPLEGVTASDSKGRPAEYLELRLEYTDHPDPAPTVLAKAGTPCASATDDATCRATLAALRSNEGWWTPDFAPLIVHRYLVWTGGDEVAAVTSLEELRDLVGEVDTVKGSASQ